MKDRKDDYGLALMTLMLTVSVLLTIFFGILAYVTSRITPQTEIRVIEFKGLCIAACVFGVISVICYLARLWAETLTLLKINNNTQMKFVTTTADEETKDIPEKVIMREEFETNKKDLL